MDATLKHSPAPRPRARPVHRWALLGLLLALSACGGGGGSTEALPPVVEPPPPAIAYLDPLSYSADGSAALAAGVEGASVTQGSLSLNDNTLDYTATAGHLTARSTGSNQDQASMFYVAYSI